MNAPDRLSPWRQWLEPLVPDLIPSLFAGIPDLAALVGPPAPAAPGFQAEPEGLSGLARRGPFERLLVTEWLLADELPDEFLRRAASGEQLFTALDQSPPAEGRATVVIFDGGPDQLGSPRLLHLAALFVFARRAAASGAVLRWTLLHQPDVWRDTAGKAEIRELLAGRTADGPTPERIAALTAQRRPDEDWWWIGGPALHKVAPIGARLIIEELPPEDRGDALRITVQRSASPPKVLDWALPPMPDRVRALRDPFAPLSPTPTPTPRPARTRVRMAFGELVPALVFSADGHRVLVRELTGDVLAFRNPDPGADADRPPRRERVSDQRSVLAAGFGGGQITIVSVDSREQMLYIEDNEETWAKVPLPAGLRTTGLHRVLGSHRHGRGARQATFLDGDGQRWRIAEGDLAPTLIGGCLQFARWDGAIVEVRASITGVSRCRNSAGELDAPWTTCPTWPPGATGAWFGSPHRTLLAWPDHLRWTDQHGQLEAQEPLPNGKIVGAYRDQAVVLDGVQLQLHSRSAVRVLGGDSPILAAATAPPGNNADAIAWIEANGRLVVWRDAEVASFEPKEAP